MKEAKAMLNRDKVVRELDRLHRYILNSGLAEKITERDIMAIVNAATLLIADEKEIKKVVHNTIEAIKTNSKRDSHASMISGGFYDNYIIRASDLEQIERDMVKGVWEI